MLIIRSFNVAAFLGAPGTEAAVVVVAATAPAVVVAKVFAYHRDLVLSPLTPATAVNVIATSL